VLLPEHKVVLSTHTDEARVIARQVMAETYNYFALANYLSNWKRMGFTDADLTRPGSDKFIDALVAYGTPDDIADRLGEHLQAGADHVVIQVLGGPDKLLPTLAELAGPLGLSR
jgi:probable F420-dependent oxidoreductase